MSSGEQERLVQSWMRTLNERDLAVLNDLRAQSDAVRDPGGPDSCTRDDVKQWYADLCAHLHDSYSTVLDPRIDWDKLAEGWGTHRPRGETPPKTGAIESSSVGSGMVLIRVVAGKAVEGWFVEDDGTLQPQAGKATSTSQVRTIGSAPPA